MDYVPTTRGEVALVTRTAKRQISEKMGVASIDGQGLKTSQTGEPEGDAPAPGHNRVALAKPIDSATGFELDKDFEPFDQRNDVFSRTQWDETVQNDQAGEFGS